MHMDCILYHSLSLPLSFLPIEATTTTVAIHATGQRMTPRGRTALSVERFQNFLKGNFFKENQICKKTSRFSLLLLSNILSEKELSSNPQTESLLPFPFFLSPYLSLRLFDLFILYMNDSILQLTLTLSSSRFVRHCLIIES